MCAESCHRYTQNYDFGFGLHLDKAAQCVRTVGDIDAAAKQAAAAAALTGRQTANDGATDLSLLRKLRPLPIGLDFHSLGEKAATGVSSVNHQLFQPCL